MKSSLSPQRVRQFLKESTRRRFLVIGDLMLDQFIWGRVVRISPEAPVPVVEFQRESLMPGGAANVARNLTSLGAETEIFGVIGRDAAARDLQRLLESQQVRCGGLIQDRSRTTSIKTRILAHQQQLVRIDRETPAPLEKRPTDRLLEILASRLARADGIIIGDYGKGVITQPLLDQLKPLCRTRGLWLSVDPKPMNPVDLSGFSLLTPNRKETFELAHRHDGSRQPNPLQDQNLLSAVGTLLERLKPGVLLVTLGDQGMLLCQQGKSPFHIPTVAKEVYDVSGAGDTVIASFTLAIACGASPAEAAIFSNHAAGVVVGKVGTATVSPEELLASFDSKK